MWNAQHRRVLASGPAGPEDFQAAADLISRNYANGKVQRSKSRDEYDKVVNLVWLGPTLEGKQLLQTLELEPPATPSQSKQAVQRDASTPRREWSKSLPIQVAVGVLIMVVGTAIIYLIKNHAGVPL